jgi:glycosyltransferase involved in cell wall biosynthesis
MPAHTKCSMLFHRGTEWRGVIRGSTNVLAELFRAAGHPIAWMMRPQHLGHVLFRRQRARIGTWRADDGTLVISPISVVPRLQWSSLGPQLWATLSKAGYRSLMPNLAAAFARAGQAAPEVIWTCGGDGGALRKYFPNALRIVQCVDLYEAFGGTSQNRIECLDYADADAVITIGHALGAFLHERRGVPPEKMFVIGQGVDLVRYQGAVPEPEDLAILARPRLVWVGVLAKMDLPLVRATLASLGPNAGTLVLIGPPTPAIRELAAQDDRVRLLGPRSPEVVPAYLRYCDVGLMLYDQSVNPLKYLGQNPLKLYEYAAAGLPILSTPHEEYRYLRPPALIVSRPDEVPGQLREALDRREQLSLASLEFAQRHTWQKRFEEASELIGRLRSNVRRRNVL